MAEYLSAREAADYCGVTEKTVRNWLAAGRLSAEKSAGTFRIPHEQLEPFRRNSARTGNGADRQAEPSAEDVRGLGDQVVLASDVLVLIREAQERAERNAAAAAMWQARCELLAGQLADAQRALQAPPEPETAQEPPGGPEAVSRPPTGLWARLAAWFGASDAAV